MKQKSSNREDIIARVKAIKEKTGLGLVGFCRKFGTDPIITQGWLSGKTAPPEYVVYLMECILDYEEEFGVLIHKSDGSVLITDNGFFYREGSVRTHYYNEMRKKGDTVMVNT